MYLTELVERLCFFFTACEPVFMNSKLGTQLVFLVYDLGLVLSPTLCSLKKNFVCANLGFSFGCEFWV